jgi:hypothetical protein
VVDEDEDERQAAEKVDPGVSLLVGGRRDHLGLRRFADAVTLGGTTGAPDPTRGNAIKTM